MALTARMLCLLLALLAFALAALAPLAPGVARVNLVAIGLGLIALALLLG